MLYTEICKLNRNSGKALDNVNSGKLFDVNGGSTADGGDVIQWTWIGGNNQRWTLVPLN